MVENTNDITFKYPNVGQKLFAPDPSTLPAHKIRPSEDPLSNPSINSPLPADIQSASLIGDPLLHHAHSYFTSVPQLQQHVSQQASMLDFYNPTYLVAQSNNLYSQHQQRLNDLFKPDGEQFNSLEYQRPEASVASLGQIYSATQDQLNELQNLQIQTAKLQEQFQPNLAESASDNTPQFAHLIDPNYQQVPNDLTSNYEYQDFLAQQHQSENEKILQKAQEEAYYQQQIIEQQQKSAHELHQEALKEQFKSPSALRIIVPDQNENVGGYCSFQG